MHYADSTCRSAHGIKTLEMCKYYQSSPQKYKSVSKSVLMPPGLQSQEL